MEDNKIFSSVNLAKITNYIQHDAPIKFVKKQPAHVYKVILEWIMEVCEHLELNTETMFLTIKLSKLCIAHLDTPKYHQAHACVGLLVAAKYLDDNWFDLNIIIRLISRSMVASEMLIIEREFLDVLNWKIDANTIFVVIVWICRDMDILHDRMIGLALITETFYDFIKFNISEKIISIFKVLSIEISDEIMIKYKLHSTQTDECVELIRQNSNYKNKKISFFN